MLSIRKQDVPEYLRASPLFGNAFQDDESEAALAIEIPKDCFKLIPEVKTESDLRCLLRTIRFWLIPEYIENNGDVFAYAISNEPSLSWLLPDFGEDFPFLSKLRNTVQPSSEYAMMGNAAKFGMLNFIKYLRNEGYSWDTGNCHATVAAIAAKHGHVECLRYALENGCELSGMECRWAARWGHLDCLKCAHEHGGKVNLEVCMLAVEFGHLTCVKYIVECTDVDVRSDSFCCDAAARFGQLEVLKYLRSRDNLIGISSANCAVAFDHVDCLQYLHETGCPLVSETSFNAVHCGSLRCVQYLHTNGCPWEPSTLQPLPSSDTINAQSGLALMFPPVEDLHNLIECFIYAAEHGYEVTASAFYLAIDHGSIEFLKYLCDREAPWYPQVLYAAVNNQKLPCLRYLLERGCLGNVGAFVLAVQAHQLDTITCLHAHNVPWDETVAHAAVEHNQTRILQYLLQHGCPSSSELCVIAAEKARLDYLKCLHEHGVPWSEAVVDGAASKASLACMRYALDKGCPYSLNACVLAASNGYLELLKCLHEHGAPLTQDVIIATIKHKHLHCLEYITSQGPLQCDASVCAVAATNPSAQYLRCLRDSATCLAAVLNHSSSCLQYAVSNGCEMNATLPAEAALRGSLPMLTFLHESGCPWDASTTAAAVNWDSVKCLEYAVSRGCPYEVSAEVLDKAPLCRTYMENTGHMLVQEPLQI